MLIKNVFLASSILIVILMTELIVMADIGPYDYGDKSSQTLTKKAWESFNDKDYKAALAYTQKCISLYERHAVAQQNRLRELPSSDESFKYWALNDVATCYYIKGQAYFALKKYIQAERAYRKVIRKFHFAQYYDPGGFTVKVADCCEKKLVAIEALKSTSEASTPSEKSLEKIDIREKFKEFDKESEKRWQKPILKGLEDKD